MTAKFQHDPRDYALEMVENGVVSADSLLLACLNYMSHDDVRDMLDANELSPRFDEDEALAEEFEENALYDAAEYLREHGLEATREWIVDEIAEADEEDVHNLEVARDRLQAA